jgi:hypothetical protein
MGSYGMVWLRLTKGGGGIGNLTYSSPPLVSIETSNQPGPELLGIRLLMMKGGH